MRACVAVLLVAGLSLAAPVPRQKEIDPSDRIAGTWVETSVVDSGEDLFAPPGSGNQRMTFDGAKFREHLKSGRTVAEGMFKVDKGRDGILHLDLPRTAIVRQPGTPTLATWTVTVQAIVKFDGGDGMTICYFDPELVKPGTLRPKEFSSTATNGAILITLKRLP